MAGSSPAMTRRVDWGDLKSYRGVGIEQPAMLVECESVGHAREVIGDDPGGFGGAAAGQRAPLAGQASGLGEEQLEQLAHHATRFGTHTVNPIVPVHPLVE